MSIIASVLVEVIVFGALLYCVKYKRPLVFCSHCKTPINYLAASVDSRYVSGVCQICAENEMARGVPLK